jgi:hypothetical protein
MKTKQCTSKLETSDNQSQTIVCDLLKIAVDVHAAFFVVACQMDGSNPKPPQKFPTADYLPWLTKQIGKAKKVVCCYEAGPTGFWLHRQVVALGATNYVVLSELFGQPRQGSQHRSNRCQ